MPAYEKPQLVTMTRDELVRELDRRVAAGELTAEERQRALDALDAAPDEGIGPAAS